MSTKKIDFTNQMQVMGHPAGLFVLFFTEMWERFSYYGMRAILVLFLISSFSDGGWEWSNAEALTLYGLYTSFVYLTPIFGGLIADKLTGYKKAIMIGSILMTGGHAAMAFETETSFYLGLFLLIIGNGMFKPNISSIVGGLYINNEEKKDGGYTIFYMGINAGAFLGMMLCGFLGEFMGWSYGFGLAGIFMLIGTVVFYFYQDIFGELGNKPQKVESVILDDLEEGIESVESVLDTSENNSKVKKIEKDRLIVVGILAFFTIFFWMAFEQAGGSMTIFAKDYTDRILTGSGATAFTIINAIITVVPLAIITWVLYLLAKVSIKKYLISVSLLILSFTIIWGLIGWKVNKELNTVAYEVEYVQNGEKEISTLRDDNPLILGDLVSVTKNAKGELKKAKENHSETQVQSISATVVNIKDKELEVPASWFGILNSLFIIMFAPLFSKVWESKYNPTAPIKFGVGLILLGLGFGILAYGALGVGGESAAMASMTWLIIAYLFHTLGELTISPVGLSYVSKLSPPKLLGLMFGFWFTATFFANLFAGLLGSLIDPIIEEYSLSVFFLIFTAIPILAGVIIIGMGKFLLKKMHGIR